MRSFVQYLVAASVLTVFAVAYMHHLTEGSTTSSLKATYGPYGRLPSTYFTNIDYGSPLVVERWMRSTNASWDHDDWKREGTNYFLAACLLLGAWALPICYLHAYRVLLERPDPITPLFAKVRLLSWTIIGASATGILFAAIVSVVWNVYPLRSRLEFYFKWHTYSVVTACGMIVGCFLGILAYRWLESHHFVDRDARRAQPEPAST